MIIGLTLIIIGIVLLILPRLSQELIKNQQKDAISTLNQLDSSQLRENSQREVDYNFEAVSSLNVQDTLRSTILGSQAVIDAYSQDIVGQLIIEDLDINMVLFNGINDDKLLVGVTTMKSNQTMGQGNYAISGHYTDGYGVLLNRLPDIQVGQTIKLTNKDMVYEYQVYETALVPSTAVHLISDNLSIERGVPTVALMSCYYFDHPTERWFAFGELVASYPYSE